MKSLYGKISNFGCKNLKSSSLYFTVVVKEIEKLILKPSTSGFSKKEYHLSQMHENILSQEESYGPFLLD